MKIVLLILFCGSCCTAIAQKKVYFSSNTNIGLLAGEAQTTTSFQTINGIKIDKWRLGIGTGIDNYGIKSIPLIIDMMRDFGTKKWQQIVYANGGLDFPLYNDYFRGTSTANRFNNYTYKLYNSFCGEAGVGLSHSITKKCSLTITAGFSYKQLHYLEITNNNDVLGNKINYDYHFYYNRLALRVGIQF